METIKHIIIDNTLEGIGQVELADYPHSQPLTRKTFGDIPNFFLKEL